MRNNFKILAIIALFAVIFTSCQRDEPLIKESAQLTITLKGINEEVTNFKTTANFDHVLTDIYYTVQQEGQEAQLINSEVVTLPVGTYTIRAYSNLAFNSRYLNFDISKTIVLHKDMTVLLEPEFTQLLVTVQNASGAPIIDGESLYTAQGLNYIYLTSWSGNIVFNDINYHTSSVIIIGKRYHYNVNYAGIIVELQDFIIVNNISSKLEQYFWTVDGKFTWSQDPSDMKLWGWTNNTAAYGNITAPIAMTMYKVGLIDAGIAGFDAMYNRIAVDPTDNGNFSSWDIGVLLYAYKVTNDQKYLDIVEVMKAAFITKYTHATLRDGVYGYDAYGAMQNCHYILNTTNISQELIDYANDRITSYLASVPTRTNGSDWNQGYFNAIAHDFNIGINNGFIALIDNDYQQLAYSYRANPNDTMYNLLYSEFFNENVVSVSLEFTDMGVVLY